LNLQCIHLEKIFCKIRLDIYLFSLKIRVSVVLKYKMTLKVFYLLVYVDAADPLKKFKGIFLNPLVFFLFSLDDIFGNNISKFEINTHIQIT